MEEDITDALRSCAALDWIKLTFAAATMREAADEIDRLRAAIRRAAEQNVRAIRNDDAPGFEACVDAEVAAMLVHVGPRRAKGR